ncbi:hypothetical protein DFH06DRAFT_1230365 [Mycena polygramma]|nr:hypothetical protein DFH06DRAFT_1230365 [Mycena polygramma]
MSSAIPHVVLFLTRPLLPAFTAKAVYSAQLILTASLAPMSSATYTLNANSIPQPLLAASIGAGIPWDAWLATLGCDEILLSFGPSHFEVCLGDAEATEVWNAERDPGNAIPISIPRVQTQLEASTSRPTNARLRAVLVSACVRTFRRQQSMVAPIRIPTIILSPTDESDSESESEASEYPDSDSDSASSASSSKFTSYSGESCTSAGSPPTTPTESIKCTPTAFSSTSRLPIRSASSKTSPPRVNHSRVDTTAYLYRGGITRVMTGGVMLGQHHLSRATHS